jgi:hypothetical protein
MACMQSPQLDLLGDGNLLYNALVMHGNLPLEGLNDERVLFARDVLRFYAKVTDNRKNVCSLHEVYMRFRLTTFDIGRCMHSRIQVLSEWHIYIYNACV